LSRGVDYETSIVVRRIAKHFHLPIELVINMLAFGKFIALDEELGSGGVVIGPSRRRQQRSRRSWRAHHDVG
jgi:hypothetical protein